MAAEKIKTAEFFSTLEIPGKSAAASLKSLVSPIGHRNHVGVQRPPQKLSWILLQCPPRDPGQPQGRPSPVQAAGAEPLRKVLATPGSGVITSIGAKFKIRRGFFVVRPRFPLRVRFFFSRRIRWALQGLREDPGGGQADACRHRKIRPKGDFFNNGFLKPKNAKLILGDLWYY